MSEVTICNLALSHLGDTATVVSIRPPDSSVQAQHCSRFYPAARDALLEMAPWGFATTRVQLAQVQLPTYTDSQGNSCTGAWQYGYGVPADMVNVLAVLPAGALDDYEMTAGAIADQNFPCFPQGYQPLPGAAEYTPKPFVIETLIKDGSSVLLTNVPDAVLRYTRLVTDTSQFSPLFTLALSHLLAAQLAGPILKGDAGVAAAEQQMQLFGALKGQATSSDANQRRARVEASPSWLRGR